MSAADMVCLSHLPWDSALERPYQVMRRFGRDRRVFFVEDPVIAGADVRLLTRVPERNLHVVSLRVPATMSNQDVLYAQRHAVACIAKSASIDRPLLWVYSPSALPAALDLDPSLVVYDCVIDHAARRGATPEERAREDELLARADLVFTAGSSLFEAKRARNVSTFPFPSSVDAEHFAHPAALREEEAEELSEMRGARVGFVGAVDERVDLALVDALAAAHRDVDVVMVGPLASARNEPLPSRPNVFWLGAKEYRDLPKYVASLDVAIIPFRGDAATRRSEPSALLAYLAANKPVVSTPLDEVDVLAQRAMITVVHRDRFVAGVMTALASAHDPVNAAVRRRARERLFAHTSWDGTCHAMLRLVDEAQMTRRLAEERNGAPSRGRSTFCRATVGRFIHEPPTNGE
jgi:UDP-galactopyranose mutase